MSLTDLIRNLKSMRTKETIPKIKRDGANSLEYKATEFYTGTRNFSTTTPKNMEYKAENKEWEVYARLGEGRELVGVLRLPEGLGLVVSPEGGLFIVNVSEEERIYKRRIGGINDPKYDPYSPNSDENGFIDTPLEKYKFRG